MPLPTEATLRAALKTVIDPEVGLNIVDLGLVYGIDVTDAGVVVRITMTSPACPMGDLVMDEAREALEPLVPPPLSLDLQLVWEPPWSPALMSPGAKGTLGWDE
ncbi:MAG TPA: metal-sulfur cluster assembly factor [Azospira sp.]|nr:metal-sulfur cluster assembly factor [Azospira sp.]